VNLRVPQEGAAVPTSDYVFFDAFLVLVKRRILIGKVVGTP
jgi:hypothetical protein